jgi:hypothetical protein
MSMTSDFLFCNLSSIVIIDYAEKPRRWQMRHIMRELPFMKMGFDKKNSALKIHLGLPFLPCLSSKNT